MKSEERQAHWEKIYQEKDTSQVSWYQAKPEQSLEWIKSVDLKAEDAIIDIGGGDSRLAYFLLQEGFTNLSVLDISAKALENAQARMANKAGAINWICSDILKFETNQKFHFWHDRAAFHFLKAEHEIEQYVETAAKAIIPGGFLLVATFSDHGPKQCSGLEIRQYDELQLIDRFNEHFSMLDHQRQLHITPGGAEQEFLFALFRRFN